MLNLLFVLCTWHAYAKLRLHTASTLEGLKATTKLLGNTLREWVKKSCSAFSTRELPRESVARGRRNNAAAAKAQTKREAKTKKQQPVGKSKSKSKGKAKAKETAGKSNKGKQKAEEGLPHSSSRLEKLFNMCTYKLHALGDYVTNIMLFGTSDGWSTQVVSSLHSLVFWVIFY